MDDFVKKIRRIELEHLLRDEEFSRKQLRRKTRAELKRELPHVESTGTEIDIVLESWYNDERN